MPEGPRIIFQGRIMNMKGGGTAAPSMAASVYEHLRDAIVSCTVLPGENLHEADLAAMFNVSKTPVREALHLLRREGLITSFARHGHQVSHMTLEDVREVYQLRLMIEPPMAGLAAARLNQEAITELQGLVQVRYVHGDEHSYDTFLAMNRRFHEIVAAASGNKRLIRLSRRLLDDTERFFRLSLDAQDVAAQLVEERARLVEALARADAVAAERIAREQIELSRQRALDAIANQSSPRSRPEGPDRDPPQ